MKPRLRDVPVLGRDGFLGLAYAEWGSPSAAQTIVCVHGVDEAQIAVVRKFLMPEDPPTASTRSPRSRASRRQPTGVPTP
jgi:hypothetical protein